ncbi:MAG: hypothetical protein KJ977_02040, partial [Candidatus Omnitrophica bacterium]|nr:hypothetical protein [Candidatus Omnitrophota bacterium]
DAYNENTVKIHFSLNILLKSKKIIFRLRSVLSRILFVTLYFITSYLWLYASPNKCKIGM